MVNALQLHSGISEVPSWLYVSTTQVQQEPCLSYSGWSSQLRAVTLCVQVEGNVGY